MARRGAKLNLSSVRETCSWGGSRGFFSLCITIYRRKNHNCKIAHRLSRVARHRNVLIYFIFQHTDRNFYKLVHGERTHTFIDIIDIVAFCNYGSFFCKSWCKVKRILLRGAPGPPHEGDGPPLEGEPPSWAGFPYWVREGCEHIQYYRSLNWRLPTPSSIQWLQNLESVILLDDLMIGRLWLSTIEPELVFAKPKAWKGNRNSEIQIEAFKGIG